MLNKFCQKASKDTIEQIINGPIYQLDNNFWDLIKGPYTKEISDLRENCEEILESKLYLC